METSEVRPADADQEQALSFDYARYLAAFRKYVWLLAALVVIAIAGAVVYTTRQTAIYEAVASIQIEPRLPDLLGTGDLFNVAAAGGNQNEYYNQQKEVLASYSLAQQTIEQNDLIPKLLKDSERKDMSQVDQLDLATRRLQKAISIKYPKPNHIMYIGVADPDPELSRTIANAHVTTYINYAKGLLSLNSSQASEKLQADFNDAEQKLRAAEEKIYKFQAENDMIAVTLETKQSLVSQNILSFTQKLNDARADQIALGSKLAQIKKQSNQDVLSTPIMMMGDNASFATIRAQYYTEKIHLLELEKDLGPKNPDYLAQKQKVDELFKALESEVKIVVNGTQDLYTAAEQTDKGLAAEVEKYKNEAKLLSPKIVIYNDLMRQKKEFEDKYNILRARLSTTQMTGSMSSIISNVRPLDPALLPTKPISPNMRNNVVIAALIAVFLGSFIIFLIVFLDRSIKSTADATQTSGVPVLGIIPILDDGEMSNDDDRSRDMYVHEHPTSHVAECCRSLRTNILFSGADRQLETILVCSANPREGKTTSVIYLGTTMAQSGQKTLLIDTDMRRPRLHASTGVSRARGLSNLMVGEEDYDSVIQPTEIPNLFVLPCGALPPNPAELLMTKRFEHVMAELKKRFTRIILDSPPLGAVTDAVVLSRYVDGVIMVVRAGRTQRDEVKRSSKQIRDVGGSLFGVIVNEFDASSRGGYYYYSYYGYGKDEAAKHAAEDGRQPPQTPA
ncbi:MAG TPA: polysaccharide biosynthesis tyrosine autokinase [Kofleriaceae bacterium]|nr:polysaccharide biosynthesis tyrosine autokinase [Kofleriaceae bacterium]